MVLHLKRRGIRPVRFHPQSIGRTTSLSLRWEAGRWEWSLSLPGWAEPVRHPDIGSVWYRRTRFARHPDLEPEDAAFVESETREAVMGLYRLTEDVFWVSHPDRQRQAESKPWQLGVAQSCGFRVPRTLLTNEPAELRRFFEECQGEVVFKTLTQGAIGAEKGQGIYTSRVSREQILDGEAIRCGPCLFQQLIPKALDLRVTVIGERVFPVEIHSQDSDAGRIDWRRGQLSALKHQRHTLQAEVEQTCLELVKRMGLRFGAIDLVLTPKGEYVFLEINPSGQFAWMESAAGIKLIEPLADLLIEGAHRREDSR